MDNLVFALWNPLYYFLVCSFCCTSRNRLSLTLVQSPTFGNHDCDHFQVGENWHFDISWVLSLTLLICYLKVLCQWHAITNAQCSAFVSSVNLVAAKQWESQKEAELDSRLNQKACEVSNWLILNQGLTVFPEMNWFVETYECREALKKIKLEV